VPPLLGTLAPPVTLAKAGVPYVVFLPFCGILRVCERHKRIYSKNQKVRLFMNKLPPLTAVIAVLFAIFTVPAHAQNGVIKELAGTVELKPAGAAAFIAAKAGDEIAPNTIVSTGFRSSATIVVGSAVIIVRPLTRLTLTEITTMQKTETINVHLSAGRVRVDVSPPAGTRANFKVQSPTATASVRGTGFELDTRTLHVLHGEVDYQGSRGAAVKVSAGGSSTIGSVTLKPLDPIAIQQSELLPSDPVAGPLEGTGEAPAGPMKQKTDGHPGSLYDVTIDLE
jgi:hypothetical protein